MDCRYDASIGNGVCATSAGRCTLRAAIQEANALLGHDTINVPPGVYELEIRVRAIDAGGNMDATPATFTWAGDATAPQTAIGTAPPATGSSTSATLHFSASEQGSTFECSLDNAPFAPCSSPVSDSNLALGAHQFRVRATDLAENVDDTQPQDFHSREKGTDNPPRLVLTFGP